MKSLIKKIFVSIFFFFTILFTFYYFNINGKIIAGIFCFIAILLALTIKRNNQHNVREIGSLRLNDGNKITVWKNSITYRYKKTAIKFLSLSKIYGIKVWENSINNINYFSNKDLQKEMKPKLYPKNYKIDIWGNVFDKR